MANFFRVVILPPSEPVQKDTLLELVSILRDVLKNVLQVDDLLGASNSRTSHGKKCWIPETAGNLVLKLFENPLGKVI